MSSPLHQIEIERGKFLAAGEPGQIWNWESSAGRWRWARRVRLLTRHLRAGAEVLELGCDTGYFTWELCKTGASITAVDLSDDLLEIARSSVAADKVCFVRADAYCRLVQANVADDRPSRRLSRRLSGHQTQVRTVKRLSSSRP